MKFFVAGLSYKATPVVVREQLAVHRSRLPCYGCRLKLGANLDEVVLLSTCNRVEIYGKTPWINGNIHRLFQHFDAPLTDLSPYLYVKQGEAAARHLFSVTAGLDSMVVGETEITGQVKNAYLTAQAAGLTGRVTNRLFQTAFQTAKEIRTCTNIGRGAVSVGSVAVELAERIFDEDLSNRTVMILGAGKMGEACVRHLNKKGARSVLVSNRSFERAQALAAEFGGRAIAFADCLPAMAEADIVVTSTGCPHPILRKADLAKMMPLRRQRPLVLIDIAVPRNIAPDVQELGNVFLYDIDDLQAVVRENLKSRELELNRCHEIIAQRARNLMGRLTNKSANPRQPATAVPAGLPFFSPSTASV